MARKSIQAKTTAEAFLALLATRGVDYLFANAGTDFPPLIEALARGGQAPTALAVPHENLAVAMAHGHTMVSGRAQAVMVHVNVGTANTLCGLTNAARDNIPMLLAAGRTPISESGAEGSRSRFIHWAQEMFDQAGMLRELVKWDYELRRPEQIEIAVDRALAIANSAPRGVAYLTLPREVLAAPLGDAALANSPRQPPARAPHADPDAIAEAAGILAEAKRPLIVTAGLGRAPGAPAALAALAERYALPVVPFMARYMCLPSDHPMHAGYAPGPWLDDADAVLVVDCDVPWIPDLEAPPAGCKSIHLGDDPLFARYPIRGFPADLAITADPGPALAQLDAALEPRLANMQANIETRRARLAAARKKREAGWRAELDRAEREVPIHPAWISHCLASLIDEQTIIVNELALAPQHMNFTTPGSYFAPSPAGGLGWGLGAALGAKLAAPERLVVAAVGDGSYMFGNPTPAHYMARAHDLPVLFLVCNNAGWGAVRAATRAMYPGGEAMRANRMPLGALEPAPDFEHVVEASGGYGERVEAPSEVRPALERALHAVRDEGRQALLNFITRDR